MSALLENYLKRIALSEFENNYWFMTKQKLTDYYFFIVLGRVVSKFSRNTNIPFFQFYKDFFINDEYLSSNYKEQYRDDHTYRNVIIAEFLGLIKRDNSTYESSTVTKAFSKLDSIIKTPMDLEKYKLIFDRQIEKLVFNSNENASSFNKIKDVNIFPVIFLYKILLELYLKFQSSALYYDEFVVFVCRSKTYSDWKEVINLIIDYRKDKISTESVAHFSKILASGSDIRFDTLFGNLNNIEYSKLNDKLSFRFKNKQSEEYISYVIDVFEASKYHKIIDKNVLAEFMRSDDYFIGKLDSGLVYVNNSPTLESKDSNRQPPKITRIGENVILYGVPGSGKSWKIKNEYSINDDYSERLVFHPDFSYSDFVGQILPKIGSTGTVSYEFVAGPFTRILKRAIKDNQNHYFLIIEELSRGNAPAIFGDLFQLLDRDKTGESEYRITNSDISFYIFNDPNIKVHIPNNLSILATMNTSDQNVFTLDTAFQRRWKMKLVSNRFDLNDPNHVSLAQKNILDSSISWEKFLKEINNAITSNQNNVTSSDDKRLGIYFLSKDNLEIGSEKEFSEKVIKYLWDDAFKFSKEDIFNFSNFKTLEDIVHAFISSQGDNRFKIFTDQLFEKLTDK